MLRTANEFPHPLYPPTRSLTMPTFHIEMFEGRSIEQKRELAAALTETTCKVLGVDASSVDIIFQDVKPENWATAGKLWSDPR
ncbi:4-oxalocrotonate tautomerase [Paraburkholderia sp. J94]|uniref:4-oxalocrotonate tautomerase n=1 Tax=Paraburkholderia sp. J94 TaxID=2805441 RepID=UPI002AB1C0E5|nr:4-oxalocrotonate tautomerase [Paraburkholderia sp. J94]